MTFRSEEYQDAGREMIDISAEKTVEDKIPIIDFADLEGARREIVCRQVARASETWGFFQVVNHGLDPELMKRAQQVSKEFFYLPEDEKLKIKVGPGVKEGWNHAKLRDAIGDSRLIKEDVVEHLYLVQVPDTKQNAERYPTNPPAYKPTILEYAKEVETLHVKIMAILLEMLGLSPELVKLRMPSGQITMRTNFYAVRKDGEGEATGICHPHSDPGSLTLLLADDVSGLEIKKDGRWLPVDPLPNAFIVNIGDIIEILSNGRYKSVEHKGMPNQTQERLTIATFSGPLYESEIGPIKEILGENDPPRYKTDTAGNYLADFVRRGLDGKRGLDSYKLES